MSSKSYKLSPLLTPRLPVSRVKINAFADYSVAYDAGMREGDEILSVNGKEFQFYDEFTDILAENKGNQWKPMC